MLDIERINQIAGLVGQRVQVSYRTIAQGDGSPEEQVDGDDIGTFNGNSDTTGRTVRFEFDAENGPKLYLFVDEITQIEAVTTPAPQSFKPNARVMDALSVLLDELNNVSSSHRRDVVKTITHRLNREHRTLQQSFWSTLLLSQIEYADADSDQRNEQAVKLAQAVRGLARSLNFDSGLAFL